MRDMRQISCAEFVKLSRIGAFTVVGGETGILALLAYMDVPLKWIAVAAFFALSHGFHGAIRDAVVRLGRDRPPI